MRTTRKTAVLKLAAEYRQALLAHFAKAEVEYYQHVAERKALGYAPEFCRHGTRVQEWDCYCSTCENGDPTNLEIMREALDSAKRYEEAHDKVVSALVLVMDLEGCDDFRTINYERMKLRLMEKHGHPGRHEFRKEFKASEANKAAARKAAAEREAKV